MPQTSVSARIYNYEAEAKRRRPSGTETVASLSQIQPEAIGRDREATAVARICDHVEVRFRVVLSWLGQQVITGLIHCALSHHAGNPGKLPMLIRRTKDGDN